jgi:hypothetical protein
MCKQAKIFIFGGLGNNLFQLNLAYRLQSIGTQVVLNKSLATDNILTNNILNWSIHCTETFFNHLPSYSKFKTESKLNPYTLLRLAYIKAKSIIATNSLDLLATPSIHLGMKQNTFIGYFHNNNVPSESLISDLQIAINKLAYKSPRIIGLIDVINHSSRSAVMHIRGGDFLAQKKPLLLPTTYYETSTIAYDKIYIVTNDICFAKKVTSTLKSELVFIEGTTSIEDFIILALAQNKILANSTFSWWAAEISDKNHTIFQPEPFYKNRKWSPVSLMNRSKIKI